jgi:hypothetical protein
MERHAYKAYMEGFSLSPRDASSSSMEEAVAYALGVQARMANESIRIPLLTFGEFKVKLAEFIKEN